MTTTYTVWLDDSSKASKSAPWVLTAKRDNGVTNLKQATSADARAHVPGAEWVEVTPTCWRVTTDAAYVSPTHATNVVENTVVGLTEAYAALLAKKAAANI